MTKDEMVAFVRSVQSKIRVHKVVCTRSVKGQRGDTFVGFSAGTTSIQNDGTRGLEAVGGEADEANALGTMTMLEAVVAGHLLGREVDIMAHNHALAGGNISMDFRNTAVTAIKSNYQSLIVEALDKVGGHESTGTTTK